MSTATSMLAFGEILIITTPPIECAQFTYPDYMRDDD